VLKESGLEGFREKIIVFPKPSKPPDSNTGYFEGTKDTTDKKKRREPAAKKNRRKSILTYFKIGFWDGL